MGITVHSPTTVRCLYEPITNVYIAFGTTTSNVSCNFDTSGYRSYDVDLTYGIWFSKECYTANMQPIERLPIMATGNVEQVSNVYLFLSNTLDMMYPNSTDDGIDN